MAQVQQSNVTMGKLLLLGALAFGFFYADKLEKIFDNKTPISVVANTITEPSQETKALLAAELETIKSVAGKAKESGVSATLMGDHFRDFTKFILSNEDFVKNTADVKRATEGVWNKFLNTYYPNRVRNPDLSKAAELAFNKALGTTPGAIDVITLTPEMRTKLLNAGNAIAWACYQGN